MMAQPATATDRAKRDSAKTGKKWVYLFHEGNAGMRDLLGGKGAGCAEMTNAGLPVPPGFTITTEACNAFYDSGQQLPPGLWQQVQEALRYVEEQKIGRASCRERVEVSGGGGSLREKKVQRTRYST